MLLPSDKDTELSVVSVAVFNQVRAVGRQRPVGRLGLSMTLYLSKSTRR
jgi:hypothetical protein